MSEDKPRLGTPYQIALWRAGCFELAHLVHIADEACPNPGITFEQFFLEFGPFASRYGEPAELRPMPGDFVKLGPSFTGAYWDYPRRAGGIINGWVGYESEEYLVMFGAEPAGAFRGPSNAYLGPRAAVDVDCSGGPGIRIPAHELKPADTNRYAHFWRWRDYPRQDGHEYYRLLVPSWVWDKNIVAA
ncbi:MAG: hypothetical protein ACJ74Q_15525 [Pyrinomonadaceae bacterium]